MENETLLGFNKQNKPVLYSDFKKNMYIIRSIRKITPDGLRAVSAARMIDPLVDATPATLQAVSENLKSCEALN